jgi:hypothetical protein
MSNPTPWAGLARFRPLAGGLVIALAAACSEGSTAPEAPVALPQAAIIPDNRAPSEWGAQPRADLHALLTPSSWRSSMAASSHDALQPTSLTATLAPGETVVEQKTLTLAATPPSADVLFLLDLTGSMGGALANVKANSVNIMNTLAGLIPDINFGFASYEDYPASYGPTSENCGYSAQYGTPGIDLPWRLDRSITSDVSAVATSINAAVLGFGNDGPESYSRAFYELYAELIGETNPLYGPVGWRTGARRIVVNFGDNVPHDCNLSGIGSTGRDPGRDGLINTADDLVWSNVLDGLRNNNVTVVNLLSSTSVAFNNLWSASMAQAGGMHMQINTNGTFPGGVDPATAIATLISEAVARISSIGLNVCAGDEAYAAWLVDRSPTAYTDVDVPATLDFDLTVGPPAGTAPGVYTFDVCAIGDGAEFGRQSVTITVPDDGGPPADELEACSPGFWSNNGVRVGVWPAGYAPDDAVSTLFAASGHLGSTALLDALRGYPQSRGPKNTVDGAREILLRSAVAAVLNEAAFGDLYPAASVAALQAEVNAALASSDRAAILDLASQLDDWNNGIVVDPDTGERVQIGTCPLPG